MSDPGWMSTAYHDGALQGLARVRVEPERLVVQNTFLRLVRRLVFRPPHTIEIRADDVVSIGIAQFRGRRRCRVIADASGLRREYWLSDWVCDSWCAVSPTVAARRTSP